MKLSVNLVAGGKYVRAGDELPPDFELPPHLDRFVVYDDESPPQVSRAAAASRFSSEGHQGDFGAGSRRLAKSAAKYPEGEEEFTPGAKMGEEIRRAHQRKERKRRL